MCVSALSDGALVELVTRISNVFRHSREGEKNRDAIKAVITQQEDIDAKLEISVRRH